MKIELTEGKLNIILAVQSFKEFKVNDVILLSSFENWYEATKDYYQSIPDKLLIKEGLMKDDYDFEKILNYEVTDKILSSNIEDLYKFEF